MSFAPGTRLGPYEILAPIGAGGMGEVYKARDPRLDRTVALKVSKAEFTERFTREARTVAQLNHANICTLHDVGPNYLVMEFVEGVSLKGPLPLEKAVEYAGQILDALDAAHRKGITHRDLKPANILVTKQGIKLLDFGLAKQAGEAKPDDLTVASVTMAGQITGTLQYMSPEQLHGEEADARSDIFAFGCVLYEMLSGTKAFAGSSTASVIAAILEREPEPLKTTPPLDRVIRTCLAKDPDKRFQNALDLKTALLWAMETSPVVVGPAATSRGRLGWIAAGLLAVAALGIALWAPWRAQKPADRPLMRMDLDLGPDRTVRSGFGPDVVLSPDGARLAWLSQNRLFTRRLDQPTATELAGTEGASSPFFSPDGQWIAFAAGGKLKKISVVGSSVVTLCDAPLFDGGTWGEDGSIVAALTLSGGLFRIPSAGGAAVPLTKLDAGRLERTHRWPQILPGGRAVLFTSNTNSVGGFDDAAIEAVSLVDSRRKTLVKGGTSGRYLAASRGSGYLIYVNRGTLFAVPLDPIALEVRGPAVPILEQVTYNSGVGAAKLDTSQSGALIYENGESSGGLVTLQWLEESGKTQPIIAKPGNYGRPSLSPDGRRLALEVLDGSNSDIWVQDLERDTMTRLTFDGKGNLGPVWTPDGRFIVFQDPQGLSWARADGSGKPQSLLRLKGAVFPWSFTSDGKNLAYMETVAGTYDLWSVPIEGVGAALRAGKPEDLMPTPFDERAPMFSPDGRWLAWVSNESGTYEIYVRAFPEAASGGGKWQISNGGGTYPMWSRTGHQLFFENFDNRIMVAAWATPGNSFAAEKPKLWSGKQLSNLTNTIRNIDLAPDGKRFAVILPVEQPGSQTARSRITLVENFVDELRRRVPPVR